MELVIIFHLEYICVHDFVCQTFFYFEVTSFDNFAICSVLYLRVGIMIDISVHLSFTVIITAFSF